MKPSKVLFVGGDPRNFASVQIRCADIARHLGCACQTGLSRADEVLAGYSAYILVKPNWGFGEYAKLRSKGAVVWDIIDGPPPQPDFALYIVSTHAAKAFFPGLGRVVVIPHQHCNYENHSHLPLHRRPGWIGNRHWQPRLSQSLNTGYRALTWLGSC
jgi:hypothetical protein